MAQYARKNGRIQKVSNYDTRLMLTLKDIIPTDRAFTSYYLVRKKSAPAGRLRDFYGCKDNGALVRKIFNSLIKVILYEVASGKCSFIIPSRARHKPKIYVDFIPDGELRGRRQHSRLKEFDLLQQDYKLPYIHYSLSATSRRAPLRIYLNKELYELLIETANSGEVFSKYPQEIDYFLPYIYEEFSYLQENRLRALMIECFRILQKELRWGEEVRFIDGDGEIRFFRNLNKDHDRVMRLVKKRRLSRQRKKRLEEYEANSKSV